jgi:hypothetical protein
MLHFAESARSKPHKLKIGTKVKVQGYVRRLLCPIFDITGGWVLDKPVKGFKCWNEKDMIVIPNKEKE